MTRKEAVKVNHVLCSLEASERLLEDMGAFLENVSDNEIYLDRNLCEKILKLIREDIEEKEKELEQL